MIGSVINFFLIIHMVLAYNLLDLYLPLSSVHQELRNINVADREDSQSKSQETITGFSL
jgi:hypothetical protein